MYLLAVIALALGNGTASAQADEGRGEGLARPSAGSAMSLPTPAQLDDRLKELDAAEAMEEPLKLSLAELYRRTQASLEAASGFMAREQELAKIRKTAPQETASIEREVQERQAAGTPSPAIPADLSAEAISQRLSAVMADVTAQETRLNELEKLLDQGLDRPAADRNRLIEVKQALDTLDDDLGKALAQSQTPELEQANRWAAEAKRHSLRAEARMLEQDLLSQSVREALQKAQRDLAASKLGHLRAEQRALEEALTARRKAQAEEAQQASEQAQREAQDKHPLVRRLILENAETTSLLGRIAKQLEGFSDELGRIEDERKRIEDDFRGAKQRLEAAGLSKALGQVLLDRRNKLPDLREYRSAIKEREDDIADATLRQIRYREEEYLLREINRYVDELIAQDPSASTAEVRGQLVDVLERRKKLLAQATNIEDDYARQLGELNYAAERVIQVSRTYDDFLAERLLWVRSAPTVGLATLTALPAALAWLISIDGWANAAVALVERLGSSPILWLSLLVVAGLLIKLSAIRRAIRANAEPLRRVRTDRIRFTWQAIGLTLLAALPLPLLAWTIGQQLQGAVDAAMFTRALGKALCGVAFGLFYLLSFRSLCMTGGVADRHFRWSTRVLKLIRTHFDWFALYATPVSILAIAVYQHNDPTYINSLGRLFLVADMIGFAVFFFLLLRPSHGALTELLEEHPKGWLSRLRHLWFPIVVGAPLALAVLAIVGYAYTASVLFQSLVYQMWLAMGLVLLHQTIVRWLIVTRRRLALQAALERQAARRAHAQGERSEASPPSEILSVEESEPDLATLDEQTRRLINATVFIGGLIGLWLTWSDVLPAFTFFERFALWHYTGVVDGAEQTIPVTAADLGLVLVVVFVGAIAAKNLPALLEILLLQSGSVSAGARYAITTLSSYIITAAAALLTFATLGLSWGQVQWLVAALGVGIGFGLQEIVANFISGIIILFERPVRVGDIVTIGDTTGVVTNISIRATTIRNWDKQELLVPNKEFITGRLLNWTLTDQQNRITIPVGIEYGSDTRQALALLAQVADQNERVLKEPAPLISFEGFGDNALTLILRCYLDSLDGRIGVISDLHQGIYDSFHAHGIQIAFPQRDVRLFTQTPLDIRLARHRAAADGEAAQTG